MFVLVSGAVHAQMPAREVDVEVTVRDVEHNPVPAVPVLLMQKKDCPDVRTNEVGKAKAQVLVEEGQRELVVRIHPGSVGELETVKAAFREHVSLLHRWAFLSGYRIPISADQSRYELEIVARPAVKVTGRLVDSKGEPIDVTIARARGLASPSPNYAKGKPGEFEIGVPQEETSEIILLPSRHRSVVTRTIKCAKSDIALGDVVLSEPERDSRLKIEWADRPVPDHSSGGVAILQLVATDGSRIEQLLVHMPPLAAGVKSDELEVPAGDYFIAIGWLSADDDERVLAVRDAARGGQDLTVFGLPLVRFERGKEFLASLDDVKLRQGMERAALGAK